MPELTFLLRLKQSYATGCLFARPITGGFASITKSLSSITNGRVNRLCQGGVALALAALVGCSAYEQRQQPDTQSLGVPQQWQEPAVSPVKRDNSISVLARTAQTRWIKSFNDLGLTLLVEQVLSNNSGLAAEAANVQRAGAGQVQAKAALYPTLDLTGSVSQSQRSDVQVSDSSVSLKAGFELDLWGKLSAREQEASLNYAVARAEFSTATLQLTAEAATGWYNLITQKQLLELYLRREDTLANALTVVEQGYANGLKEVTDLYAARDSLQNERDTIAAQKQRISEQVRALQVLLGRYPDGRLLSDAGLQLPELPAFSSQVLPSELLSRSPELQAQWLSLLAADAGLAAANRERFPSLSLTASVDQNIDWNLMASLTQPLFNAGKLAAAEDQAAATVEQKEKRYLQSLFATFADVENTLMQETTLQHRYGLAESYLTSARQSAALALSQYQLGLVPLDNLLAAQKNMLDAEAQLITLRYEQFANRIELYKQMGGDTRAVARSAQTADSRPLDAL